MTQRLLVEGVNDLHFISNLALALDLPKVKGYETAQKYRDEFVVVANSKNNIKNELTALLLEPNLSNLGIILDTDQKTIDSNWQSVTSILKNKYESFLPKSHDINGPIIQTPFLKIGIWIMPNNQKQGYLEHFFEDLIDKNDEFWQLTNQITEGFIKEGKNRFKPIHKQKADVHTWLAWQKDPEAPMGRSLISNKNHFDLNVPLAKTFETWWRNTFELAKT
jgi:hypothetical protein